MQKYNYTSLKKKKMYAHVCVLFVGFNLIPSSKNTFKSKVNSILPYGK